MLAVAEEGERGGEMMHKTATPRLLLRPSEAARALAISPRKLWAMTNCGEIPCVRLGRAVRYRPSDLTVWIDSQIARNLPA